MAPERTLKLEGEDEPLVPNQEMRAYEEGGDGVDVMRSDYMGVEARKGGDSFQGKDEQESLRDRIYGAPDTKESVADNFGIGGKDTDKD